MTDHRLSQAELDEIETSSTAALARARSLSGSSHRAAMEIALADMRTHEQHLALVAEVRRLREVEAALVMAGDEMAGMIDRGPYTSSEEIRPVSEWRAAVDALTPPDGSGRLFSEIDTHPLARCPDSAYR